MLSILILTRNEEQDLPGALASVAFSDDIHVLDSFSTDGTVAIAEAFGAHVTQRPFDTYAAHRNFGFTLPFKHPWLLILDADERVTPRLAAEIQYVLASASETVAGYRIRRRDFLFNTWLKHAQLSPFYIRLVRPERSRYTRSVNEVLEVDGTLLDLAEPFDHFPFSKGISHWVAKHNTYSTLEAEIVFHQQGIANPSLRTALTGPDFHIRRLHQKALFYRMPGRPLIKFCYMFFGRLAFLDGAAGLAYALLQSFYEYLIVLKTRELQLAAEQPAVSASTASKS
jgi:glycosyltransferase involved in cell wall biosynthesis